MELTRARFEILTTTSLHDVTTLKTRIEKLQQNLLISRSFKNNRNFIPVHKMGIMSLPLIHSPGRNIDIIYGRDGL